MDRMERGKSGNFGTRYVSLTENQPHSEGLRAGKVTLFPYYWPIVIEVTARNSASWNDLNFLLFHHFFQTLKWPGLNTSIPTQSDKSRDI